MTSIFDRTRPASEVRKLKALFFGPAKSGKTTLAATAPKAVMLDTEGGTMSIRDTDVDVLTIATWKDFDDAVLALMLEPHGYESVILDSVTLLQEIAGTEAGLLKAIMEKEDPRRAYGSIGAMIRHKILQLNALNMNVIITAQLRERDGQDLDAGQYPLTPDVTPSILKTLMAAPDVIGRTKLTQVGATPQDVEHRVVFGPETRSQVGHRDLALPVEVKGLTIPKLITLTTKAQETK